MSRPVYEVALPVFEGPLDLLLRLIEREELDITQISLARVAGQFLDYVAQMEEADADRLAEFLVIAGKLLLIKSRALLPRPKVSDLPAEEEDLGQDLVDQLVEYRKFKQAAGYLRDLQALGLQSYVRVPGAPTLPQVADLEGITVEVLLAAVREALEIRPPEPLANGTVPPLIVTVAEQIERIRAELAHQDAISFSQLLKQAAGRLEIVVTFLAILELVKRRLAVITQDSLFGDIVIMPVTWREA